MDARVQQRIQRYGWDLAVGEYEPLWEAQLAAPREALLQLAALVPGQRVLDVACGTGLVSFAAAHAVGRHGSVVGVDLSGRMVEAAMRRARQHEAWTASFVRMVAQSLALPAASFDVVLCALGLMYVPDPAEALREMRRVLRPGGRLVAAVWGERARCGFAPLFEIVDAEVASEVCPLFFALGQGDALASACASTGLQPRSQRRIASTLDYADGEEACRAAFVGGPVALAWSRFAPGVRERACGRYLEALAAWRSGEGYRVPAEFVVVSAVAD
jgi:ubiquinone/menaquinone biosynthesis C-methylase UbiE